MTNKARPIAISLPDDMVERIDAERGDVTRSRYIFRILEKHYVPSRNKK